MQTEENRVTEGLRVCVSVLSCSLFCVRVYVRTCVRMVENVWRSVRAKERMRDGARKMENTELSASQRRAQCMRFLRRNRKSDCF